MSFKETLIFFIMKKYLLRTISKESCRNKTKMHKYKIIKLTKLITNAINTWISDKYYAAWNYQSVVTNIPCLSTIPCKHIAVIRDLVIEFYGHNVI